VPTWDDLNATRLGPLVAYTTDPQGAVTVFHFCTAAIDWIDTAIPADDVTNAQPLTLADDLDWTCCGLHGRVHAGHWSPA